MTQKTSVGRGQTDEMGEIWHIINPNRVLPWNETQRRKVANALHDELDKLSVVEDCIVSMYGQIHVGFRAGTAEQERTKVLRVVLQVLATAGVHDPTPGVVSFVSGL